ncbi:mannosyltransferase [Thecaphora frezii]
MQSQFIPKDQSIRFNRPADPTVAADTKKADAAAAAALLNRRNALLQDYNKLHQKPAWSPAFNAAARFLLIIRVASAMYSVINDCDEAYNYWEPLHLLIWNPLTQKGVQTPFQTWEYAPQFAIRSWAYLAQYVPLAAFLARLGVGKRQVFFSIRILLAVTSTLIEARFYKAVADTFNSRVGRYLLLALAASPGMFDASTALLPSSFAMYATMLAYSFALSPARLPDSDPSVLATPQQRPFYPFRLIGAVVAFAAGAIIGWPFALVLSAPFVLEQLFCRGDDVVPANRVSSWTAARWSTFIGAAVLAATVAVPLLVVDTLAYGRMVLVPLNIIKYNLFSGGEGAGPELYGTEPAGFYFANLLLNFTVAFPLALLAAPLLALTAFYDPKRLQRPPPSAAKGHAEKPEPSSLLTLTSLRIAPFYLWLGVLSLQAHKEERFMYPAYPLLCMNAAISLYLIRSLLEVAFVRYTKSPYRASRSRLFTTTTATTLGAVVVLGVLRIVAQLHHYHSPMDVLFHLEGYELPRVVAARFPETLNEDVKARIARGLEAVATKEEREYHERGYGEENAGRSQDLSISLEPLRHVGEGERITLCYAKEWHRFPSHFFVPFGVEVKFVESEFEGILPKPFSRAASPSSLVEGGVAKVLDGAVGQLWPYAAMTRSRGNSFNHLNVREPHSTIGSVAECDYLVDLDLAHRFLAADPPQREARYVLEDKWQRVKCFPFLDAEFSRPPPEEGGKVGRWFRKVKAAATRSLWSPWKGSNVYGEYCLLRNAESRKVVPT